jgi:hypothetical protein
MRLRMRTLQVGQFYFNFLQSTELTHTPVVAVAAHLAKYKFTLKTSAPSPYKPGNEKTVPQELSFQPIQSSKGWETGVVYADAQNLARTVPIVS